MPGIFSVVLITDLRAACAVEVNLTHLRNQALILKVRPYIFCLTTYCALWMKCILRKDRYSCATNTKIPACNK